MLLTIYYVVIQKSMSPRKSGVDVTINFSQKQSFSDILQNRIIKNFVNFTGKHLCWSLFLIKFKADFNIDVFPWNFVNFKNIFFTEHVLFVLNLKMKKFLQVWHFSNWTHKKVDLYILAVYKYSRRLLARTLSSNVLSNNLSLHFLLLPLKF